MDRTGQLRRKDFKNGMAGRGSAQDSRRREALELQRARRSNTFDSIRGIEDLSYCFLDDDSETDGRYDDADEGAEVQKNVATAEPSTSSKPVATQKNRYHRYRDRCMFAEVLDLSSGLPASLEEDWILVGPVPQGKRCLALSLSTNNRARFDAPNTTLLSRATASRIGDFKTIFPPNCIFDCIYDSVNQVLWVLDILKWKGQALIDCEASFRFWWRDTKLAELSAQNFPKSATLLVLSIPASAQFSKDDIATMTAQMMESPSHSHAVSLLSAAYDGNLVQHSINYQCDGLLMYLKSATYESGETVLAGWIPLHVGAKDVNAQGIQQLNELCQEGYEEMRE